MYTFHYKFSISNSELKQDKNKKQVTNYDDSNQQVEKIIPLIKLSFQMINHTTTTILNDSYEERTSFLSH